MTRDVHVAPGTVNVATMEGDSARIPSDQLTFFLSPDRRYAVAYHTRRWYAGKIYVGPVGRDEFDCGFFYELDTGKARDWFMSRLGYVPELAARVFAYAGATPDVDAPPKPTEAEPQANDGAGQVPTMGTEPAPGSGIDYEAVITRAGKDRRRNAKALVAFMRDRHSAPFDLIKDKVHGSDVEDGAVRKMVSETNVYLKSIGWGRLVFTTDGAVVYKSAAIQ